MGFTSENVVLEQDIYNISSVQTGQLGAIGSTKDGREFVYALAGGTALAAGKLTKMAAAVTTSINLAVAVAVSVGDKQVSVTTDAITTQDQFKGGYLVGYDASGTGQSILIRGNTAAASGATMVVYLEDPSPVAITTSGKVHVVPNLYSGVIITASGDSGVATLTGVPNVAVTAANYAWLQVKGVGAVLTNGTPALGAVLVASSTTDGAVDTIGTSVASRVGNMAYKAGVTAKYNPVLLNIR